MKKVIAFALGFASLLLPFSTSAATILFPVGGGTGSSTLSGILIGNGTSAVNTLSIGSGLSLIGSTLSATGGSTASSTLLSDFNTWTGNNLFKAASTTAVFLSSFNSTTTNATSTALYVSGPTVLANATTTNTFSGTASSTNLFATSFYSPITIYQSFTYPTSTAWTGTTTRFLETVMKPTIYNSIACFTDTGTVNVDIYHGSTHIKTPSTVLNASTTNNVNVYNTGNAASVGDKVEVDMGTPASSPTQLNCTVSKTFLSN